jgi:hypothetical protein
MICGQTLHAGTINMKHLILILSILILSSCVTKRACNRKFPPDTWATTEIKTKERIHLMTIRMPELKLIDQGTISTERSILETDFARSEAWVLNDSLFHQLHQKGVSKTDTVRITETETIISKGEVRYVNQLNNWQVWLMVVPWVLLFLIVVYNKLASK